MPRGSDVADIFISYNREDQPLALVYKQAFEAAGLDVWWDQTLRSGDTYDEVTEAALRAAKAVVVLWSPRSVVSRWVRAEATIADRTKTLLPVMVEPCERPIMFELVQTADLIGWNGQADDRSWKLFLDDVCQFVGRKSEAEAARPSESALPLPEKPSIAVLPFANLGGDPDQAYFVDGLMDEVVTCLTRIKSIFVIGSGTSMSLKGHDLSAPDIGRRLGVRYLLEGSVRRSGERIRVSVKLMDAQSAAQVWTERFDETFDDIFELQDKIALGVAGALEYSVQAAEWLRAIQRPTSDLKSYDLHLRALAAFRHYTREGIYESLDLLNKASALDPDYALPYALAASCHVLILQWQWTDDMPTHGRLLGETIGNALKKGSDNPEVLATASLVQWASSAFGMSAQLADRAIELNPGSGFPLLARGLASVGLGELDRAVDCLEKSLRLDPRSPNRSLQVGGMAAARFAQHRYDEAIVYAREWTQLAPNPMSLAMDAATAGKLGDQDSAAKSLAEFEKVSHSTIETVAAMLFGTDELQAHFLEAVAFTRQERQTA